LRRIILAIVVVAIATLAWAGISALQADNTPPGVSSSSSASVEPSAATSPSASSRAPAFAFYYLWWSIKHWHDKLGPDYQYGADPLPLPASLPPDGCPPNNLYAGNELTDVPAHLWSQDDPGQIQADEREAASAGLTGFAVNWVGGPTYDARLADAFRAADKLRGQGIPFSLVLSYKSSATVLPLSTIAADLTYYRDHYASDPAQYELNGEPVVILQGSWKYDDATLTAIDAQFGDTFRIIGDETPDSYTPDRGASMYGVSYYWSTQDPYSNPESFGQLQDFANAVRATAPNPDDSTSGGRRSRQATTACCSADRPASRVRMATRCGRCTTATPRPIPTRGHSSRGTRSRRARTSTRCSDTARSISTCSGRSWAQVHRATASVAKYPFQGR